MNSKDFFENYYKNSKELTYSKSLFDLFNNIVRPRLKIDHSDILEIGAGSFSFFEDVQNLNASVTAIDFSEEAIVRSPKSSIIYKVANVVDSENFQESSFDLIFDSHCLNCITNESERDQVLKNIYQGLKPEGIFASELMVQPIGKNVSMPFKKIKTALELEQEIITHGFKIFYFAISANNEFSNVVDGIEIKCDVLKLVCQKK